MDDVCGFDLAAGGSLFDLELESEPAQQASFDPFVFFAGLDDPVAAAATEPAPSSFFAPKRLAVGSPEPPMPSGLAAAESQRNGSPAPAAAAHAPMVLPWQAPASPGSTGSAPSLSPSDAESSDFALGLAARPVLPAPVLPCPPFGGQAWQQEKPHQHYQQQHQPQQKRQMRDAAPASRSPKRVRRTEPAPPAAVAPSTEPLPVGLVRVSSSAFQRAAAASGLPADPASSLEAAVDRPADGPLGVTVIPDADTRECFFPGGVRQLYTIKHHGSIDYDFELNFTLSRPVTAGEFDALGLGARLVKPDAQGTFQTVIYQHRSGSAAADLAKAAERAAAAAEADPESVPKRKRAQTLMARLNRNSKAEAAVLVRIEPGNVVSGVVMRFMSSRNGVHVKAAKDACLEIVSNGSVLYRSNQLTKVRALRPSARN